MLSLQVSLATAFLILSDVVAAHQPFNPREYPKKVVSCPAINRAENTPVDIQLRTNTSLFLLLVQRLYERSNPNSEIILCRRLRRHQSRGRRDASSPTRLAEPMGKLEISDPRVSGYDRPLVPSHATRVLIFPFYRMTTTSSHRTFVALGPRRTQVTSSHPARCPTSLATSCAFSNTLLLRKQSPSGT